MPTQREALPHIIASEPSALNMRMEKSASGVDGAPISTSPSPPMPLWRSLHRRAVSSGWGMSYSMVFT